MSAQRLKHRRLPLTLQLGAVLSAAAIGVALVVALVVTDRERRGALQDEHAVARRAGVALARRAAPLLERGDDMRLAVLAASVADVSSARVLLLDATGAVRLDTGLTLGGSQLGIESGDGIVGRPVPGVQGAWEVVVPALSNAGFAGEVRLRYRPEAASGPVAWDVFGTTLLFSLSLTLLACWLAHQWVLRVRAVAARVRALGDGEAFKPSDETPALGELADALEAAGTRIEGERVRARDAGFDLARRLTRQLEQRGLAVIGHGDRTRRYAMMLAEEARIESTAWADLGTAAVLVDLGKAGVRASALEKRGDLSDVERESLRQAPARAASFLAGLPHAAAVARAIRHHHEKYDGTGYPDGLRGERIPIASRVLAIADAYDLLTSAERGAAALSWPEALERLRDDRGEHFDPDLLDAFEDRIRREPMPQRASSSVVLQRAEPTPYKRGEETTGPVPERDDDELYVDLELELLRDDTDPEREDGR